MVREKKSRAGLGGTEAENINIRFPQELRERLEKFCGATYRSRPDVIRAAVELLLADGDDVAELRLMRRLWDLSAAEIQSFADGLRRGGGEQRRSRTRKTEP